MFFERLVWCFFTLYNSDDEVVYVVFMPVKCKKIPVGNIGAWAGAVTMATRRERVNLNVMQLLLLHLWEWETNSLVSSAVSPPRLTFSCFPLLPLLLFSFSFFLFLFLFLFLFSFSLFSFSFSSPSPSLILPFLLPSQDRVNVNNSCLSSLRQKCASIALTHTHTHTHTLSKLSPFYATIMQSRVQIFYSSFMMLWHWLWFSCSLRKSVWF